MIQATLDHFRDHGFADLGRIVDPTACAALLSEIRRRRRFDADMFLTERAFLADPQMKGVNPRPGCNMLEGLTDYLESVERHESLGRLLKELLGPGYAILNKKLVCGVPERWIPDWLVQRIKGNPVNNLGAYVRPEYRDVTYFYGIDFHQDIIDWSGREADFVTLYVYLHGVGPAEAPLQLLADSHRLGATRFPHRLEQSGSDAAAWRYGGDRDDEMACRQTMLVGGAGFAALWHPFTLHGTQPHAGDGERISLRYLIAKGDGAPPAFIDAVNAEIAGARSMDETRSDLGEDGSPILRGNAINSGGAEPGGPAA